MLTYCVLTVKLPLPWPVAGELIAKSGFEDSADQVQFGPVLTSKLWLFPIAGNFAELADSVYWQPAAEPGSVVFHTPRPCVKAIRLLSAALRSSTRISVTVSANGLLSRDHVRPPSVETN